MPSRSQPQDKPRKWHHQEPRERVHNQQDPAEQVFEKTGPLKRGFVDDAKADSELAHRTTGDRRNDHHVQDRDSDDEDCNIADLVGFKHEHA